MSSKSTNLSDSFLASTKKFSYIILVSKYINYLIKKPGTFRSKHRKNCLLIIIIIIIIIYDIYGWKSTKINLLYRVGGPTILSDPTNPCMQQTYSQQLTHEHNLRTTNNLPSVVSHSKRHQQSFIPTAISLLKQPKFIL